MRHSSHDASELFQKSRLISYIFVFLLCSCTHSTTVITTPSGADAYAVDDKGQKGALLGKTPLLVTQPIEALHLAKNGYIDTVILLPNRDTPWKAQYTLNLMKKSRTSLKTAVLETEPEVANELIADIIKLQGFINNNKFAEADAHIKKIKSSYEQIATFHVLVGHYYYLKKDSKNAKESYLRAIELDRTNAEARQMLGILKVNVE